jgi:hypothetical protein
VPQNRRAARCFTLCVASTSAVLAACGASYQSVYEGDVRFEHCYRLDADAAISSPARLGCWSDWTAHHTVGQTRDRVEYALGRERALRIGDTRPAGPSLVTGIESTRVETVLSNPSIATPIPATPFESPPITLAASAPTASAALVSAQPPPELTSGQQCVQECGRTFTKCATACGRSSCVNKCGDLAKLCIGQCL